MLASLRTEVAYLRQAVTEVRAEAREDRQEYATLTDAETLKEAVRLLREDVARDQGSARKAADERYLTKDEAKWTRIITWIALALASGRVGLDLIEGTMKLLKP